jgi:hypothetical protein
MGTGSVIRPGDVQRMSAGTGVTHSEFNASQSDPLHFLQIWILPEARGLKPGYEQRSFTDEEKRGRLRLIASRDGAEGSIRLAQDVRLYATLLAAGEEVTHAVKPVMPSSPVDMAPASVTSIGPPASTCASQARAAATISRALKCR